MQYKNFLAVQTMCINTGVKSNFSIIYIDVLVIAWKRDSANSLLWEKSCISGTSPHGYINRQLTPSASLRAARATITVHLSTFRPAPATTNTSAPASSIRN
jgi:hypothetical protein